MTRDERKIAKAILDVLHDLDGGQVEEIALHSEVNLVTVCTRAEFENALRLCDTRAWLTGIKSKFGGKKWNINDAGESARMELAKN